MLILSRVSYDVTSRKKTYCHLGEYEWRSLFAPNVTHGTTRTDDDDNRAWPSG